MPLAAGDKLGPYEILAPLGAGGMGEVYRARDTRLDRQVAIKVAKDQFSERFEREARAVAALNHPHICHLYDIGPNYLVMEFIEGVALRGPMAAAQAVAYGVQVLEALEAAHSKGIVHRDLKPANVLVTPQGVKLLDFGLAKMQREAPDPNDETQSMDLTRAGAVLGTPAYMAPEQWEGRAADARSDIYAFGCLFYEMVTGKKAGADRAPVRPAKLESVLGKCLARNPDERWQSAAEVREHLRKALAGGVRKYVAAAVAVVMLAGAGYFLWQRSHAAPLTDKDVLVLADFANTTGDPVFDGALRQALVFQLEQSPFLKIMDDEEVHHALELMRRAPNEHLTAPVARDVCRRENEKATLEGSISSIGQTYLLTLQSTNCQTGATLARAQQEARSKNDVLKTLAKLATEIRIKLGESLPSTQRFDRFYTEGAEVTTSSLEALRAFSLGDAEFAKGNSAGSAAFVKQATELDPNFAFAYAIAGTQYGNIGRFDLRDRYIKKGFALIEHAATQRERLFITALYETFITGDLKKVAQLYEILAQTYPRDSQMHGQLALTYFSLGQIEKALPEDRESVRLGPRFTGRVAQLEDVCIFVGRLDEAKAAAEKAIAQNLGRPANHHLTLWRVAFIQNNGASLEREDQWFKSHAEEPSSLVYQALIAAFRGQDRKARVLSLHAGNERLAAALEPPKCDAVQEMGLVAGSLCNTPAVKPLEEQLKQRPNDTLLNAVRLPVARAGEALKNGEPGKALESLRPAASYERVDPNVPYNRGLAYLRMKNGTEAAAQFQSILDWGILRNFVYLPSYLGLAQGAALAGDTARARKAYQDLLAILKDADPDNAYLLEARKGLAALH